MGYRYNYLKGKSNIHVCKYCGAIKTTRKITVDHVLPQNFFKKLNILGGTYILFVFLLLFGINFLTIKFPILKSLNSFVMNNLGEGLRENLMISMLAVFLVLFLLNKFKNSKLNLVASCKTCNSSKSDKLDLRVVQGFLAVILFSKAGKLSMLLMAMYIAFYKFNLLELVMKGI